MLSSVYKYDLNQIKHSVYEQQKLWPDLGVYICRSQSVYSTLVFTYFCHTNISIGDLGMQVSVSSLFCVLTSALIEVYKL